MKLERHSRLVLPDPVSQKTGQGNSKSGTAASKSEYKNTVNSMKTESVLNVKIHCLYSRKKLYLLR